jgi:DnaJ-class molecular chaperone
MKKKTKVSKTQKPANCTVPYQKCPVCEGMGQIFVNQFDPYNTNSSIGYKPCHVCGGSGIIPMHIINDKLLSISSNVRIG